jgi:4-diphosphocytidyl-2-C-methyl-D-erythritol kinase
MVTFPGCKINIGLYVTAKRQDGFHDLCSVFYPVDFQDAVEIAPSDNFSFEMYGLPIAGEAENNLCVRAWKLLAVKYEIPPVSAYLLKHIPTGAGLGGGSSDGVAMLKMLNTFFKLNISDPDLEVIAAQLGSDCPFFVKNKPALVTGRGENLKPIDLDLKGLYITIVFPEIFVSTTEAFRDIRIEDEKVTLHQDITRPVSEWQGYIRNTFEETIFQHYPELQRIKDELYVAGAKYASMSGSGSAIYSLSNIELNYQNPDYRIWKGRL